MRLAAGGAVLTLCVGAWALGGNPTARIASHLALYGLAFAAYLLALHGANGLSVGGLRVAVGLAIAWRAALVLAPPLLSNDVNRYVWEGRVQVHGGNPYAWRDRPDAPRWEGLRDAVWQGLNHKDYPAVYPPLFQLACRGVIALHDSVTAMKAFLVACELLTLWPLAVLLRRRGLPRERLLILAWSPLALVEIAGSGHNEAFGFLFLAWSMAALEAGRPLASAVAAAFGFQAKFLPGLVAAAWARRYRPWQVLVAAAVAALLALPYFAGASKTFFLSLSKLARFWRFNETLFAPLAALTGDHEDAVRLGALLTILLALALAARRTEPVAAATAVVAAALLLGPNVLPWYALWFLPLLVVRDEPAVLLYTGTAALAYLVYPAWQSGEVWYLPWSVRALEYGPCGLVLLWSRGRSMRLALLAAAVGPFAFGQEKPPVATFPSAVDLITVDAVVLDKDGRPVSGLTRDDFAVSEDGKPQAIASFEAINLRRDDEVAGTETVSGRAATNRRPARTATSSFVLLVDDMSLAPPRQETVRTTLARFLSEGMRDGDELIFATTSGDAWWSARMPEGKDDVLALVARVRGRKLSGNGRDDVSDWEAYRITHFEGKGDGGGAAQLTAGPVNPVPQPGQPSISIPGAEATQRVVERYYERRVCIPDPVPPFYGPMTPVPLCRAMVQARAQEVDLRRANRTRDVLAAVDRAVFALTGVRGRKSLLLLTEGFLNDADLAGAQEVAGRCREANIAVYSLDVRGLITGLPGAEFAGAPNTAERGLMQAEQVDFEAAGSVELAEDTGGFAVRNTNDLAGGAGRIADESRVYYLLGYTPPPGKGPRDWRKLKVQVKRPGLQVRARKGYTLRTIAEMAAAAEAQLASRVRRPKPAKGAEGAAQAPPLPADVARALAGGHEIDDIPVRAMAYAFEERPGGLLRTLVAVEAHTGALANLGGEERPRAALSLSIVVTHRDSGQTRRVDQRVDVDAGTTRAWQGWLAVSREFSLPPGVAQARVVVRDEFLGRLGSMTVRFVVPSVTGLRVSTPVLSPRLLPHKEGMPLQPALLARREFEAAGVLYCQFHVFGAAVRGRGPQVEASFELRRGSGELVRRGPPSLIEASADGRLVRLLGLPLDGLAEGDYELRLRVEDKGTGETQERVEPLRLTARTS